MGRGTEGGGQGHQLLPKGPGGMWLRSFWMRGLRMALVVGFFS